ncbi:ATP-binding protein [Algoriphagus hitonicola]|uniref:AAA+ ATPase domain-containing protein n=1 Tax=Algoriphagus hitonicola TaxID=435880 RepID=A0A1I2QL09_9BACT|nr:AAA family ATPase [Algoriphagus hitonicola]SFG26907.1 hypothetical protein SAMN04487988_102251 [Algoriphagus hitonicola]
MEKLLLLSQRKVAGIKLDFQRFLLDEIDWSNRLIGILGARGTGKTTLLLQHLKRDLPKDGSAVYVSLDDFYFTENRLLDFADEFYLLGGKTLLLDEIHRYPTWSQELKLIFDNLPDLKLIFTSSSILEIYKGEADLSRRLVSFELPELSFREFIQFEKGNSFPVFSLAEMIENHVGIAEQILEKMAPIPVFLNYLKFGSYPYYKENRESYYEKLKRTVQLTLELDINAVENLDFETIFKLKKLIRLISTSVPFTPNVSELSRKSGISRPTLLRSLELLNRAKIIQVLHKPKQGIGALTKPDKIYLANTNLLYALGEDQTNVGTVRETFFCNQLRSTDAVYLADRGDFLIGNTIFEIGGKNKSKTQIKDLPHSYLVKDDIEIGIGNTIPLWLFGFLY